MTEWRRVWSGGHHVGSGGQGQGYRDPLAVMAGNRWKHDRSMGPLMSPVPHDTENLQKGKSEDESHRASITAQAATFRDTWRGSFRWSPSGHQ